MGLSIVENSPQPAPALEMKPQNTTGMPARAYRLLALMLVLRPFGNLSLAWGMRHFSSMLALNPFFYLRVLFSPYVALGIGALIFSLFTRMALMSLADLSVILPLTASGYILSALLGKLFLREDVDIYRWMGTILIFAGALIVASSTGRSRRSPASLLPGEH